MGFSIKSPFAYSPGNPVEEEGERDRENEEDKRKQGLLNTAELKHISQRLWWYEQDLHRSGSDGFSVLRLEVDTHLQA